MRRVALFLGDFWRSFRGEFVTSWYVARAGDCKRNGGHRWGETAYDQLMTDWGQTCRRCQTWRSIDLPAGYALVTYPLNATTAGGELWPT